MRHRTAERQDHPVVPGIHDAFAGQEHAGGGVQALRVERQRDGLLRLARGVSHIVCLGRISGCHVRVDEHRQMHAAAEQIPSRNRDATRQLTLNREFAFVHQRIHEVGREPVRGHQPRPEDWY